MDVSYSKNFSFFNGFHGYEHVATVLHHPEAQSVQLYRYPSKPNLFLMMPMIAWHSFSSPVPLAIFSKASMSPQKRPHVISIFLYFVR